MLVEIQKMILSFFIDKKHPEASPGDEIMVVARMVHRYKYFFFCTLLLLEVVQHNGDVVFADDDKLFDMGDELFGSLHDRSYALKGNSLR